MIIALFVTIKKISFVEKIKNGNFNTKIHTEYLVAMLKKDFAAKYIFPLKIRYKKPNIFIFKLKSEDL